MSIEDSMADSVLSPTRSTLLLDSTYQSQSLISSLIPNSTVNESTSKLFLVAPQHLVEVYFKEGIIVHNTCNHYAARRREFNFGPFHSSLGPVPLDATIIQKLNSPFLETLLSNYKDLALDHLVPPTTLELPDIVDHVTKWEERYPHILYNIGFPAQVEWQNRLKKYSFRMAKKTAVYTDWETVLWCKYSEECIISIEQPNIDLIIKKSNDFYDKVFKLFGATHPPMCVAKRFAIHGLYSYISEYGIDVKRLKRYAERPHYLDYTPPARSLYDLSKIEISSSIDFSNSLELIEAVPEEQSAGVEEYLDPRDVGSLVEKLEVTRLIEDNGDDRLDVEGQLRSRKGWST